MRKKVCLLDLTIRGENTDNPYIEWVELKSVFDHHDYYDFLKFILSKGYVCRKDGIESSVVVEFLKQSS